MPLQWQSPRFTLKQALKMQYKIIISRRCTNYAKFHSCALASTGSTDFYYNIALPPVVWSAWLIRIAHIPAGGADHPAEFP